MKLEVTEQGVVIPKNLLEGAKEVDVRKENKRIVVTPMPDEDPIFRIGKNPVRVA
jgi:virulence-associated protein VagC